MVTVLIQVYPIISFVIFIIIAWHFSMLLVLFFLILTSFDRILIPTRNVRTRNKSTYRLAYILILFGTLFWCFVYVHSFIFPAFVTFHHTILSYYSMCIIEILFPAVMIGFNFWSIKNVHSISHMAHNACRTTARKDVSRFIRWGPSKDRY